MYWREEEKIQCIIVVPRLTQTTRNCKNSDLIDILALKLVLEGWLHARVITYAPLYLTSLKLGILTDWNMLFEFLKVIHCIALQIISRYQLSGREIVRPVTYFLNTWKGFFKHSKQFTEAPLNGLFKTIYTADQKKDHNTDNNQSITQTNGLHLYQALAKRWTFNDTHQTLIWVDLN